MSNNEWRIAPHSRSDAYLDRVAERTFAHIERNMAKRVVKYTVLQALADYGHDVRVFENQLLLVRVVDVDFHSDGNKTMRHLGQVYGANLFRSIAIAVGGKVRSYKRIFSYLGIDLEIAETLHVMDNDMKRVVEKERTETLRANEAKTYDGVKLAPIRIIGTKGVSLLRSRIGTYVNAVQCLMHFDDERGGNDSSDSGGSDGYDSSSDDDDEVEDDYARKLRDVMSRSSSWARPEFTP